MGFNIVSCLVGNVFGCTRDETTNSGTVVTMTMLLGVLGEHVEPHETCTSLPNVNIILVKIYQMKTYFV